FYTPSTGIWQTVWLEPVPKTYIDSLLVEPDIDGHKVRIIVQVRGASANHKVAVSHPIYVGTGRATGGLIARVGAPGKVIDLDVPVPRPWSPENPFLYDSFVVLSDGNQTIDEAKSYFAMRKIEVGKDEKGITRILLNGKPYFQVGPLDQGFWPD